jgi:hypothetical protein
MDRFGASAGRETPNLSARIDPAMFFEHSRAEARNRCVTVP